MQVNRIFAAARLGFAALALACNIVFAHAQSFDAKKFFDKLAAEGATMPKNMDAKAFFDKLAADGASDSKKLDTKTFFDKLAAEGANIPKDFDTKKFFDKLKAEGASAMPPMIDMSK